MRNTKESLVLLKRCQQAFMHILNTMQIFQGPFQQGLLHHTDFPCYKDSMTEGTMPTLDSSLEAKSEQNIKFH